MPKKKSAHAVELTFEQAIQQLESIVQQMDDGELGLEESLEQFEKGTRLLRHCSQILRSAEQKIELLTGFDESGEEICEQFDATSTLDQREQTAGRRTTEKNSTQETKKRNLFSEEQ